MARIVIVDDDEIVAEIASDVLAAAGHMTNAVHDGVEALKAIYDGEPDLVILDYELPGETGMEVLRQIRAMPHGRGMLVMMLTGSRSRLLKARAEHIGANDYVVKPFRPDDLVERVETLLAGRSSPRAGGGQ